MEIENEDLLLAALTSETSTGMELPMMNEEMSQPEPSCRGETVSRIVQACGLQNSLDGSVCLHCQNSVLAQDSKLRATLYCSALFRDLETCITDCTAHSPI